MTDTAAKSPRFGLGMRLLVGGCFLILMAVDLWRHLFGGQAWPKGAPFMLAAACLWGTRSRLRKATAEDGPIRHRLPGILLGAAFVCIVLSVTIDQLTR